MSPDARCPEWAESHSSAGCDDPKNPLGEIKAVATDLHEVQSEDSMQSHATASSDDKAACKPPVGPGSSSSARTPRKKGVPWTEQEHRMFLLGLEKLGRGDWRGISWHFVKTRSPTQVASHAQKHFLRQTSTTKRKKRNSLFDMVVVSEPTSGNTHEDEKPARKKVALTRMDIGVDEEKYPAAAPQQPLPALATRLSPSSIDATSAVSAYHLHLAAAAQQQAAATLAASYGYGCPYPAFAGVYPLQPAGVSPACPHSLQAAYRLFGGAPAPAPSRALPVAPLERPPMPAGYAQAAGDVTTLAQLYSWTIPSSRRSPPASPPRASELKLHRPVASLPMASGSSLRALSLRSEC